jgi:hypothetical protein
MEQMLSSLTRKGLMKIKARAMRHRVWFKALPRAERAIMDLTIKCVERVRSPTLTMIVSSIVSRVLMILKNRFLEKVNTVGSTIAKEVCRIALAWGNVGASSWTRDSDFIKSLGVNAINSKVFSVYEGCTG